MGKHKYTMDMGNTEIFAYYKRKTGNPHNLTQGKMMEIFDKYITYVRKLMIENSFKFRIPHRQGSLYFYKYKVKYKLTESGKLDKRNLRIDWFNTKKYWSELYPGKTPEELKLIKCKPRLYHLNNHTDGQRVRMHWSRTTAVFKNKMVYSVKPLRVFTRQLAKALKTNPAIDFSGFDAGTIDYATVRRINKIRMQSCGMENM
jgi:hypothetical protein